MSGTPDAISCRQRSAREASRHASAVADRSALVRSGHGAAAAAALGPATGSRRSGGCRTRSAPPRRPAWAAAHGDPRRRATTRGGSGCCSSTARTRSARRASSCSSPARPTTTAGSASSSTATSARSRRSSRRSTRTARCRSSTPPGSSTQKGRHPAPYTVVSAYEVEAGVWRAADPEEQGHARAVRPRALAERGRYRLTVWPYHAMLGGIGHALVSAVEEAVFFHAIARQLAGRVPGEGRRPPRRALLGPRPRGRRPAQRGADRAPAARSTRSWSPGQAKSHCVAWTVEDLLQDIPAERVYLLEDCTSPVVVSGAVDFTAEGERGVRALRRPRRPHRPLDAGHRLLAAPGAGHATRLREPRRRARAGRSGGSGGRPWRSRGRR